MINLDDGVLDLWYGGHLMAFSGLDGPTDFDQCLVARSGLSGCVLEFKLPGEGVLRFPGAKPQETLLASDFFHLSFTGSMVRGVFLDTYHLLVEGPCQIELSDERLAFLHQGERLLVGSAANFDPALITADLDDAEADRRGWLSALELPTGLEADRRKVLVSALSQVKSMVYAPEGMIHCRFTTPDRWPHRGMWLWDSAFHAIGLRHIDLGLARETIEAVLDGQQPDGMLPLRTDPKTCHADYTQPPVLAMAARLVDEIQPDLAWIARLYPRLAAYVRWDVEHRDSDGAGLVEWAIEGDVNCRSGESGMDNSPRFDAATRLDAVDFNAFLALECETLALFAHQLGMADEAQDWHRRWLGIADLINARLWDESAGFYLDYDVEQNRPSPVLAASGFMPLIAKVPSSGQAERLARHLADPSTFGTPLPVASTAASQPAHAPDMWRGPVWVNLNWLIAAGFERYGMEDAAEMIRGKTIGEIEKFVLRYGTFFEFFDDQQRLDPPEQMRKGRLDPGDPFHQAFFDYGWTATLYLDLVLGRNKKEPSHAN